MSIRIECESCGEKRKVNERLAGRTIRCPGCDQPLTIPELPVMEETPTEVLAVPSESGNAETASVAAIAMASEMDELKSAEGITNAELIAEGQAEDNGELVEAVAVSAATADSGASSRDFNPYAGSGNLADSAASGLVAAESPGTDSPRSDSSSQPRPKAVEEDDEDGMPPRKKRDDGELDMTPMVDVTFLLLIFFMVTASFSLQKSIKMPRQSSDLPSMSNVEEETEELDPIELEIDENGAFLVLSQDGETETPGKQNLIKALKVAIGNNKDGMRLDIKVHENAKLQFLVDGMDAGTIAGFNEIQVTEVDGF